MKFLSFVVLWLAVSVSLAQPTNFGVQPSVVAAGAGPFLPRILSIGGIEASDLFTPPVDVTDEQAPWGPALGPDLQKPQAHRIIYGCFVGPAVNAAVNPPVFAVPSIASGLNVNNVRIQLVNTPVPPTTAQTLTAKIEHPYLEIDPYQCSNVVAAANGDCRCNLDPIGTGNQLGAYTVASPETLSFQDASTPPNPLSYADYIIPSTTYFEHAPFPGQNPFMRTYQKLCIQPAGYTAFLDTTIWIAVTKCCAVDSDCTKAAVSFSWFPTAAAPLSNTASAAFPGATGANAPNYAFTSLPDTVNLPASWVCNKAGYLGAYFTTAIASSAGVTVTTTTISALTTTTPNYDSSDCWGETQEMTLARQRRLTCCGAQVAGGAGVAPLAPYTRDWLGITNLQQKYGTCIDTNIDSCCGWKPFNPRFEQCCSKYHARINNLDQPCKCQSATQYYDCQRYGANSVYGTTSVRGESETASGTRLCCVNYKYPELMTYTQTFPAGIISVPRFGTCYDVYDPVYRCCDDGNIYDIGSQQCCVINGVQSLNMPCPCSADQHCNGLASSYMIMFNQVKLNMQCCIQQWPRSWPDGQGPPLTHCDKYSNWPDGTAPAEVQRCIGNCFDNRFQSCCNGRLCVRKYERCCNSTCCNRFISGCMEGTRPGTRGFGSRVNALDYGVYFETCTSVEVMTTRRAFWVWVMPTFWCIATVVALAIVSVVGRRATENSFPLTERCMVFFGVFLILLCAPHYFSPTYKYGVVIVFGSMFAIVGAVMQSRKMSLLTIFVVIGMLILWFDPFNGNLYFSLPGGLAPTNPTDIRVGNNPLSSTILANFVSMAPAYTTTTGTGVAAGRYYSGILEALFDLERNKAECTGFYDYFTYDPMVHDMERFYNPAKTTFGFCTRAWMTTLLIFSCVSLASLLVLLMLSVFSYAKKVLPKSHHEDTAYNLPMDTQVPYA